MNIQVQLCGLFILVLLFIFYKSHKTLQLYKEKIFYMSLCIMLIDLFLDISSIVSIYYRHSLSAMLVEFVCKTYIISLIWGSFSALVYVATDLLSEKKHKKYTFRLSIFTLLESLFIYFLPIHIFDDGSNVYTYGASVACVYIFVALYIILTLIAACVFRKRINPRRRFAIVLWMIVWIISAIIQFLNQELLVVGFAGALGVLILFVIMENPEANLDRRLGCFNSHALTEYLNQLFEAQKNASLLEITFKNPNVLEEHGMDTYVILQKILHLLNSYQDILVFANINLGLVLISQNADRLQAAGEKILDNFSDYDTFNKEARFILTTQTDSFADTDELFHFLSYIHTEYTNDKGRLFIVNENVIAKYKEQYVIQQEIADALSEDRVEVFLQPIYSNQNGHFTSAEALVRIRKKNGDLLSPGIFIPIAEDTGQILALGERVIEKVCDFLKNTNVLNLGIHYIEVNLSVIQCEKEDLAERLISIVEKYHINPKLINLEITETASISARTTLLENMKQLIKYGFSFSLDDFGKGESNLMYVVEMPVSIVKLDYDISKAFFSSPKAKHVVRAVVRMAHDMNLKLVAEGIETKEELERMCTEGIDYIQGYYYSKPLPMKDFLDFLKNQT